MRAPHAALLLLGLSLSACTEAERGELPDWSDYYAGTNPETGDTGDGGSTDVVIDSFGIGLPVDLGFDARISKKGDSSAECTLDVPEDYADYQSMDCVIEMNELDLYAQGLRYDVMVPEGDCDYLLYWHYQYQAYEVGIGPEIVSYTVTTDGTVTDEQNISSGVPVCEYDYSLANTDAPNCCLGTYKVRVTYEQEGGAPEVVESTEYDWGGDIASCYAGAAFDWPQAAFNEDGWPMGNWTYLGGDAISLAFEFDGLSTKYGTNVNLANYYDPADHDGSMPAGFQPVAEEIDAWLAYSVDPNPYYIVKCTDNAWEVKAQLRLQVREWNEEEQFYAEGNPNSGETGTEPASGEPLNDLFDWRDVAPGDSTYNGGFQ